MYRQLYQTKISDDFVRKLEKIPGGILPIVHRIEMEYGVKILYHERKDMILVSPSKEVLQLAQETLETRYVKDESEENNHDTDVDINETSELKESNEINNPDTKYTEKTHLDNEVFELYNKKSPLRSRGHSRSPARSVLRSPSKSPRRSPTRVPKRVVFAQD